MGKRADGEGTICKRKDGRWVAAVTLGYDVDKGKPIRKFFYGKTQGEVKKKLDEALDRARKGYVSEPSKMLLAEWIDLWLNEYSKPAVRPTTWESYEMQVRLHIKPHLGHIYLQKLQTVHIQKFYNRKQEPGGRADGKKGGVTPRGIRYIHTVLRQALEQAKKEGHIIINPCDNVNLPKQEKKKSIKYFDTEDLRAFLNAAKGDRHFPAFYMAIATGLRRGELLALRWEDLDLKEWRLSVNRNLVRTKGNLLFQDPKTDNSRRTIDLPEDMINILTFHKKKQENEKKEAGEAWQDNGLVFCNEIGGPLDPDAFVRNFKRKLKAAGLNINFHALRNTYATLSLQQGVDFNTISETLGHYDPGFTLRTYAGVTETMKKAAAEKVGALLNDCVNLE